MNFNMREAVEILERTPRTLACFLTGLSDSWLQCREGEETWNVAEVLGHLIAGEKTNWMRRVEMILQEGESKPFPPFDRWAHLQTASEQSIQQDLLEFQSLRAQNLAKLQLLVDPAIHLGRKGTHPEFGSVSLQELLAAWVVHDLTHMSQIVRIMAARYKEDTGPWIEYLGILRHKNSPSR